MAVFSWRVLCLWTALVLLLTGCAAPARSAPQQTPAVPETGLPDAARADLPPVPAAAATPTAGEVALRAWISPDLPAEFRAQLRLPAEIALVDAPEQASLVLTASSEPASAAAAEADWLYVLAAPFPEVEDSISSDRLRRLWVGDPTRLDAERRLLVSAETQAVLSQVFGGPPGPQTVQVMEPDGLLEAAWAAPGSLAILPFGALEPRWKLLRIDGISPLEDPHSGRYALNLRITLTGEEAALQAAATLPAIPLPTNFDRARLTTLAMTGVTALSRHIGAAMEAKGVLYPARDIQFWFQETDLTHISNEVSFYSDCPKPGPKRADMRFCSSPRYMDLLEAVGADIIELTGNHNLDWGPEPYRYTLERYQQRGWAVYGGGESLAAAKQPLKIEHHGNRLAFLGCSPAGPEPVWAKPDRPGSAPCDLPWMEEQIALLRAEGYLPIVTLQAVETDTYQPGVAQGKPIFRQLARAGAVIVSGSQAHVPQTMTFVGDHFVHYGLGNLFFDQMEPFRSRQNFIDRHIFYDGRYLGVELLTTLLEDSARPRPMTPAERREFLTEIFALSDWSEE